MPTIQPYSPMTIRFFILQAHYRGTVDFSNEALQAAETALGRMLDGYRRLQELKASDASTLEGLATLEQRAYEALDDDLNTPQVIAHLFEAAKTVNAASDGKAELSQEDIDRLKSLFDTMLVDILGLRLGAAAQGDADLKPYEGAVNLLMEVRAAAKQNKDWATSDLIRNRLAELGFNVKDTKNGVEWSL